MTDLLIRNIDPNLKRQLEKRARQHRHSLSEEAKTLLRQALAPIAPSAEPSLGTRMFSLVREEDRGDDLVFEVPGELNAPPDFE
jgi:plasmid stability protein